MRRDYYTTKFECPYKRSFKDHFLNKRILYLILLIFLAGIGFLLFFSPFFKIKNIILIGTKKPEIKAQIDDKIQEQLKSYRFLIFKQNNIFFLDKKILRDKINEIVALDRLVITKKLPATLEIEILEKKPFLILKQSRDHYFVDQYGKVIKKINSEEVEGFILNLPCLEISTSTQVILNDKIMKEETVSFIQNLAKELKTRFESFKIDNFSLPYIQGTEIRVKTKEGWQIYFESNLPLEISLNNLERVLKEKIKEKKNLEYIDLRLPNWVYYK